MSTFSGSYQSLNGSNNNDYKTIKYNSTNGSQQWVATYNNSTGNGNDEPYSLAISGNMVFVTGTSYGGNTTYNDIVTIAYYASQAQFPFYTFLFVWINCIGSK